MGWLTTKQDKAHAAIGHAFVAFVLLAAVVVASLSLNLPMSVELLGVIAAYGFLQLGRWAWHRR